MLVLMALATTFATTPIFDRIARGLPALKPSERSQEGIASLAQ
jgi:hypothetical protein